MAVLGLVWGCFGLFWVVLLDFGVVLRCFPLFPGVLLGFVIFCVEFGSFWVLFRSFWELLCLLVGILSFF